MDREQYGVQVQVFGLEELCAAVDEVNRLANELFRASQRLAFLQMPKEIKIHQPSDEDDG